MRTFGRRTALGRDFGCEPGTLVTGKMVSALRQLGFDYVFDTDFAADLTIMEEGTELLQRLSKYLSGDEEVKIPMMTSCCPGWVSFVEQHFPELREHLSTAKSPNQCARLTAEVTSEGGAYSRSSLGYHNLSRISQCIQYWLLSITATQGIYRTDGNTLSAIRTGTSGDITLKGCRDGCVETTVDGRQGSYCLNIVTHRFATAAHDTFIHVTDDGRRTVYLKGGLFSLIPYFTDTQVVGYCLQFAISVAATGKATGRMVGQNQFHHCLPGIHYPGSMGPYNHSFRTFHCPVHAITGSRKVPHTIDSDVCIRCGSCIEKCKFDAIYVH